MRDGPARSETPCTHGTFLHENREICESPAALVLQDAPGRPKGPKPVMYGSQKSDEFVVPMRPSNEAGSQTVEEAAEGRSSAKGNTAEQNAPRTQCRTGAPSALCRVREAVNQVRFECQNPRWEPSAVVPLARICAGGGPRHLSRAVPTAIPPTPVATRERAVRRGRLPQRRRRRPERLWVRGSTCRCPSSVRAPRTSGQPRHHRSHRAPLAQSAGNRCGAGKR